MCLVISKMICAFGCCLCFARNIVLTRKRPSCAKITKHHLETVHFRSDIGTHSLHSPLLQTHSCSSLLDSTTGYLPLYDCYFFYTIADAYLSTTTRFTLHCFDSHSTIVYSVAGIYIQVCIHCISQLHPTLPPPASKEHFTMCEPHISRASVEVDYSFESWDTATSYQVKH